MVSLLENALIPALISAIISALVTWFSGDRWVEINRRKREHTLRLNSAAIKPWADLHINETCQLSTYYEDIERKVFGEPVNNYENLNYNTFIESHIKKGYPDIDKRWQEIRALVQKYNDELASILEDIRMIFHDMSSQFELEPYYSRQGRARPPSFVQPYEIAKSVFQEYENRINGMEKWYTGAPSLGSVSHNGKNYLQLAWMSQALIVATRSDDVEAVRSRINEILNNFDYFGRIGTLTSQKMRLEEKKKWVTGGIKANYGVY